MSLETEDRRVLQVRAPIPQNHAEGRLQVEILKQERENQHADRVDDTRRHRPAKSILRRRPFAFAGGLILLFVALPAAYLYWDYTAHFESTDDAFIAARQFAIAPEVPGYLTAVRVTDNQHVAAGGVIVRIDDRDYRIAVE